MDGDYALYKCHHCDLEGAVRMDDEDMEQEVVANEMKEEFETLPVSSITAIPNTRSLTDDQIRWLGNRGIGQATIEKCGLVCADKWISSRKKEVPCIGFPYLNHDGGSAIKWRDGSKNFTQTGSAGSLWRIEEFHGGDLIITEGEMDAMSFIEIGIDATSVPNGANLKLVSSKSGTKFNYLWEGKELIDKAKRIIIAGDNDAAGQILPEEIARRLGKAKCWRMQYPADCKDANDVLVKHGASRLKELLKEITPWPIGGLRGAIDYKDDALAIYRDGMSKGVDIPVGKISKIFRPSPGTLTICTGVPGSGKSSFVTWLSYLLALQEGWPTAIFAAETSSPVHLLQLASLRAGEDFRGSQRMSEETLSKSIEWASERFVFLDEAETSIQSIIERAQAAVLRNGVQMLIVDPFNFVTFDSPKEGENEQRGIVQLLTSLKTFSVAHDVATILIAHPKKMYRDSHGDTPIPTGYDISGSSHFFNICDSGITLSRDGRPNVSTLTSWKARFSWLGSIGKVDIGFNPIDGSFNTIEEWGDNPDDWNMDD